MCSTVKSCASGTAIPIARGTVGNSGYQQRLCLFMHRMCCLYVDMEQGFKAPKVLASAVRDKKGPSCWSYLRCRWCRRKNDDTDKKSSVVVVGRALSPDCKRTSESLQRDGLRSNEPSSKLSVSSKRSSSSIEEVRHHTRGKIRPFSRSVSMGVSIDKHVRTPTHGDQLPTDTVVVYFSGQPVSILEMLKITNA